MAAIDNFTPTAQSVVKLFAYTFRSAPTADLVVWGANQIAGGQTAGALTQFIFDLPVPQSPFTAYAQISSNAAFCAALVDNFTFGTSIAAPVKANWSSALLSMLPGYASRGAFAVAVGQIVETYAGSDADLLALKAALAQRLETAASFAQSPAGAVWDRQGFAQLLAPLAPPQYQLAPGAATVEEGQSVTFTLQTTNVAAGTVLDYTLTGVDRADTILGVLSGVMTVGANGQATATIGLVADLLTEGNETLRLTVGSGLAGAEVTVLDTSRTPPPPQPTYTLSSPVSSRNEGTNLEIQLTTTNVAAGAVVAFTLSGTGITAGDIGTGTLGGQFTVNSDGFALVQIPLAADNLSEGPEVLRLALNNGASQVEVTINDTSTTPPVGGNDTVIVPDVLNNPRAGVPASAEAGEIPINTYLTYDFLNQSMFTPVRMSVAALKASGPTAGAPLNPTNFSADRGNLPQLSNQGLVIYDLGAGTDRVDYSAEAGKVVAVLSAEAPAGTQYMLVNDNGTDDAFSAMLDRLDVLKDVEEIVAARGEGVIDLTASNRSWQITFSRNFNTNPEIDASRDRATHRIELADLSTFAVVPLKLIEYRDAGQSGELVQAPALWNVVQGSDHDETLVLTAEQATETRTHVLRGGNNSVKYNDLARSLLADVAIGRWLPSTTPADDTNASGRTVATLNFTDGDGVTLLSAATHTAISNTPDNGVSAGVLKLTASRDTEDAVSFNGTPLPKIFHLGAVLAGSDVAFVHLAGAVDRVAAELHDFELLRDNGASDDLYSIEGIFRATQGALELIDGAGDDHDAVRLNNEALGSAAVGGALNFVSLATLDGPLPGFGVDFDVLDLSLVTASGLQATGTAGTDDELVVGALVTLGAVSGFEALVLTRNSTDRGNALVLDLDAGAIKAGTTTLFSYGGSALSAGGLMFGTAGQTSVVAPMDTGMVLTVNDSTAGAGATLWGGNGDDLLAGGLGNDVLRGGDGNDTLDGGAPVGGVFAESWAFTIAGTPDAVAAAANRITIAMTIDGAALTLTEAAVADTAYGDGNGAVVDGASRNTIGTAMAGLINANLAAINAGPGTGTVTGANYDGIGGVLTLNFLPGLNANDVVTFVLNSGAGPDGGNFTLSAGVNVNGSDGGADRFVFERSGFANGRDIIVNFTPASDKLDMVAFAGAPIAAASPALNATAGGGLAGVPTTLERIFNKPSGAISENDFAISAAPGKFAIPDGTRCVVTVTADPTGSRGDAANTPVSIYYVDNGPAAGLSDLRVSLVGVVMGPVELTLAEIFAAMT